MRKCLLIGLDIGTSGAKCLAADEDGTVLASSVQEYPLYTPRPGWAEQHPEDWWQAVRKGLAEILPRIPKEDIAGIAFSGQMHGLVALDKDGQVIRPAYLWCDQRSEPQCLSLTEKAGGQEGLLRYTNNRMLSGYTGGKLLRLKENEPGNYEKMVRFICPKDYVRFKLTGIADTDVSEASGTGFFDTRNRCWSEELIGISGLDRNIFPEVHESIDLAGRVTRKASKETGLPEGTAVYYGGGDAVIQTTGTGLISPGTIGVVIGTAGNVSMALDHFYPNPNGDLQMFCNNEPGLYHAFGCPLTSGGAYRWYRDAMSEHMVEKARLTQENVYDLMGKEAEMSVPGSNGVIFTPYLTGERCPYPDANARASFYGLSLKTTRADITRSVLEGVTFSLRQIVDIMQSFVPCSKVVASGGGSVSALWRQMQA
ncbi:MAG: xylulokinase, partial [Lachnospiraceae bacterium]|nr:xylulokinase [Lachnospiraceae bacterium]